MKYIYIPINKKTKIEDSKDAIAVKKTVVDSYKSENKDLRNRDTDL